jgi:hypothetical protein
MAIEAAKQSVTTLAQHIIEKKAAASWLMMTATMIACTFVACAGIIIDASPFAVAAIEAISMCLAIVTVSILAPIAGDALPIVCKPKQPSHALSLKLQEIWKQRIW